MPKKGKKRRDLHRQRKLEREARAAPVAGEEADEAHAPPPRPVAPRARQRKKRSARRLRVPGWAYALPLLGVAAVLGVIAFTGGPSESPVAGPAATPDPRVAGQAPVASFRVEAGGAEGGSYFAPDTIEAPAGEVFEIVMPNTGPVSHNLRIAGVDGEYFTGDDFVIPLIKAGEEGRLLVKLDEPGRYEFQCDFHAQVQKGVLVVN
jgi:plastocyanin